MSSGSGTRNAVNEEVGGSDYAHITMEQSMQFPDRNFLISLAVAECGTGHSDFLDALVVAVDGVSSSNSCAASTISRTIGELEDV